MWQLQLKCAGLTIQMSNLPAADAIPAATADAIPAVAAVAAAAAATAAPALARLRSS